MYFGDKDKIQFQYVRVESEMFSIIEWLKNKCAQSVTECMAELKNANFKSSFC